MSELKEGADEMIIIREKHVKHICHRCGRGDEAVATCEGGEGEREGLVGEVVHLNIEEDNDEEEDDKDDDDNHEEVVHPDAAAAEPHRQD